MTETRLGDSTLKKFLGNFSVPTIIIGGFWIVILILGVTQGFPLGGLLSDTITRFGRWGILVLAMMPSIQSGTGPNFALPIGICCGLLAIVITIELGFTGLSWLLVAVLIALVIAAIIGYLYGKLLNAVRGSEMVIATYAGFTATFVFCVIWMAVPFTSPLMGWMLGDGLRSTLDLSRVGAAQLVDNFLSFTIFGMSVPTGLLMVVFAACTFMWLFFRSRAGISISAVGSNPMFAKASGINADRKRILANMISTMLAAVGIILYGQSFGFTQLYDFPLLLAFQAVASILVGGATAQRARVFNVIIGTLIFQGILTNALPVFTTIFQVGDLTDIIRLIIQNSIILFALTRVKGVIR